MQCQTSDRPGQIPFKDVILDICDQHNDEWARQVEVRVKGAVSDLPAADAQYHKKCYDAFMTIPKKTNLSLSRKITDDALKRVVDDMYAHQNDCTWASVELYDKYKSFGGTLSRKQMFQNLTNHLGEDVVVIHMEGCVSVVGFRHFVGKSLKLIKTDVVDKESVESVVKDVKKEACDIKYTHAEYDLNSFTHKNTVNQTSATLLKLISDLVSDGEGTQISLSISQVIQSHITNTRNQTTLGLAAKLYHKYGSSELIKTLHDHGFTVSYDEMLRFRKSCATFVAGNTSLLHQAMGLTRRVGPIFGWFDNLDLLVSTPNGRRETHVMAHQFQMNPAGIIEKGSATPGVMNLVIPRIRKTAVKSAPHSPAVPLQHYSGPKKVNPPIVSSTEGILYKDLCVRGESLASAQSKNAMWLNSLFTEDGMEWSGFNNKISNDSSHVKPATVYLLGHLIDSPPSHPDTVFTSLLYMGKALKEQGMEHMNLSIDMQLYMTAQQIKWWDKERFKCVVLRPGSMHILMSFLGCIGSLMKG